MESSQELIKCRNCALRLIKFRPRSEKELTDKLKERGYCLETVRQTLEHCRKNRLVDDRLFARVWAQGRMKKPFGLNRVSYELVSKGVAQEVIERAMEELRQEYREEDVVQGLIRAKLKKYNDLEPKKAKARLFGFLLRRGFSKDLVIEALSRIE